jgi:YcxB-like protein
VSSAGAPAPLTGRVRLSAEDGVVLMRASRARIGFVNQPRLLLYCAVVAMLAAILAIESYRRAPLVLLAVALLLFGLAIVAGLRTTRSVATSYGHGQEREIAVGADGVSVRETGMSVAYDWSRFDRALEGAQHLVLFAGPGIVVVPKRAFADGDVARVRELIAAKLPLRPLP